MGCFKIKQVRCSTFSPPFFCFCTDTISVLDTKFQPSHSFNISVVMTLRQTPHATDYNLLLCCSSLNPTVHIFNYYGSHGVFRRYHLQTHLESRSCIKSDQSYSPVLKSVNVCHMVYSKQPTLANGADSHFTATCQRLVILLIEPLI